ncbi:hypothetical protein [Chitinophaga rhizophila]|uniref:Uncharacterized protein n=1 Tax=Chitinophaga rhizophila TaxID=2866212 RepID=A0ABS7GIX4_9BACT|nr:hypothetical protein [Chitinophaga rhizophila]MBW8687256.1 hypothetical protein [Chitinophaga rhizophila]
MKYHKIANKIAEFMLDRDSTITTFDLAAKIGEERDHVQLTCQQMSELKPGWYVFVLSLYNKEQGEFYFKRAQNRLKVQAFLEDGGFVKEQKKIEQAERLEIRSKRASIFQPTVANIIAAVTLIILIFGSWKAVVDFIKSVIHDVATK